MREILFKAKRIDNGEWVEGWIVPTMHNTYHDGYRIIDVRGINYDELDGWEPTFISWEVDKDTLCRYTGLTDKNGNKIWENDVVVIPTENGYFTIKWSDTEARWEMENEEEGLIVDFDNYWSYQVKVVGNIFDNPELIEGSE